MDKAVDWPPAHSIRRSRRARSASLKISPSNGLEVILPMRYKLTTVPELLTEKRAWIEKNWPLLQQFDQRQRVEELPRELYLTCVNEFWKINYLFSPAKTRVVLAAQQELTVFGDIDDIQTCFEVLRHWLRQKAEQILAPQLYLLSQECQLPFQGLTIRNQKTRWGSCSSQKAINLNFKLIFLPPNIVRHILLHELCHTVHLNHSRKFWRLLASYDSEWRTHHRMSRNTSGQLPLWIDR